MVLLSPVLEALGLLLTDGNCAGVTLGSLLTGLASAAVGLVPAF